MDQYVNPMLTHGATSCRCFAAGFLIYLTQSIERISISFSESATLKLMRRVTKNYATKNQLEHPRPRLLDYKLVVFRDLELNLHRKFRIFLIAFVQLRKASVNVA